MPTPSNTHRQATPPKQWLLIVFDGSRHHELMASIGLKPSKSKAGQYIRFYPPGTTGILRHQIDRLKKAGLHGVAKKVEQQPRLPREPRGHRPKTKLNFGCIDFARHNRTPGTYRLKQRRK